MSCRWMRSDTRLVLLEYFVNRCPILLLSRRLRLHFPSTYIYSSGLGLYSSNIHNFNISKFGWLWSHVMPLIFVYFFHMASEVRSLFRTLMTAQHTVLDFSFFDSRVKWMETMNEWTMKIRDSEEKHSSGEQVMRLALWLLWERESPSDRRKKRKHIPPQNLSKSIRGRLIMAKQNQSHHSRAFTSSEVKWGRSLAAAPPFLMKGCTVSLTQTDREEEKKKKAVLRGRG